MGLRFLQLARDLSSTLSEMSIGHIHLDGGGTSQRPRAIPSTADLFPRIGYVISLQQVGEG